MYAQPGRHDIALSEPRPTSWRGRQHHDTTVPIMKTAPKIIAIHINSFTFRSYQSLIGNHDGLPNRLLMTGITASRSEEHTSELQSLMRTSYAVFRLKKQTNNT